VGGSGSKYLGGVVGDSLRADVAEPLEDSGADHQPRARNEIASFPISAATPLLPADQNGGAGTKSSTNMIFSFFEWKKSTYPLNYWLVSNLGPQLQNRVSYTLKFGKPDKEPPRAVWEGGFADVASSV
jgi:hypothetical protein